MIKRVRTALRLRNGAGGAAADVERLLEAMVTLSAAGADTRQDKRDFTQIKREVAKAADRWGGAVAAGTAVQRIVGSVNRIAVEQPQDNARMALRTALRFSDGWGSVAYRDLPGRVTARSYLDAVIEKRAVPEVPRKGPVAGCLLGELLMALSIVLMQAATDEPQIEARLRPVSVPTDAGQEPFAREWAEAMAAADRAIFSETTIAVRDVIHRVQDLADWWGMDRAQAAFLSFLHDLFARTSGGLEPELMDGVLDPADPWCGRSSPAREWLHTAFTRPDDLPLGRTATAENDTRLLVGLALVSQFAHLRYGKSDSPAVLPTEAPAW